MVGDIKMDIVVELTGVSPVEDYDSGKTMNLVLGGKAANQAVAASRLGANTSLFGFLGDDELAEICLGSLRKERINIRGVRRVNDTHTEGAIFLIRGKARQMISVDSLWRNFTLGYINEIRIDPSDIVVTRFKRPVHEASIRRLLQRGKRAGATTVFNATDLCSRAMLGYSDYIIANEFEAAFNVGGKVTKEIAALRKYAKKLISRPDQTVIITLGSNGVYCLHDGREIRIPGVKVKLIDATGAGDCFIGAFATALSESKSIDDALKFANKAAAISVQRLGASTSMPTRKEVERKYSWARD